MDQDDGLFYSEHKFVVSFGFEYVEYLPRVPMYEYDRYSSDVGGLKIDQPHTRKYLH